MTLDGMFHRVRDCLKSPLVCLVVWSICSVAVAQNGPGGYKKSTEGDDVVKNKLYPKKGRVELNGPNFGSILNQSYIDTFVLNGGLNYFWSEVWGIGLEFTYAMNRDRDERKCIENFYNDPNEEIPGECGSPSNLSGAEKANFGPAFANVREYNYIFGGNLIWNPIYGKEIFFMSAVGHFDVFFTGGAGMAFSTFYPLQTKLRNGKDSRGDFPADGSTGATTPGSGPDETDEKGHYYGTEGRPTPISQSNIMVQGGIGQKFHFGKGFHIKAELRYNLVLGTPDGFDMFFTLWGGVGYRF